MTDKNEHIKAPPDEGTAGQPEKVLSQVAVAGVPDVPSDFINQCLDANELGDGALFAYLFQRKYLYVATAGEWYFWTGHYWQLDITDKAAGAVEKVALVYLQEVYTLGVKIKEAEKAGEKDRAKKFRDRRKLFIRRVERLRSERGVRACLRFARIGEHSLAISGEEMDNKPWLLACANGVINLRNGMLSDGRPEDYLSLASPFDYLGSKHTDPIVERFMLDIFNDRQDVVDYMRKVFGYSITGLATIHNFYCLHGEGRNGKGRLVEIISEVLGPLAAPIQSEMLLDQKYARSAAAPSPEIMKLKGLRFAYASETDEGRKFSGARVKWLVGDETLTGRWPNDKRNIDFKPTHTLFLLTNHKPRVDPDDFAFWERLRLILFEMSFVTDREIDPEKNERQADIDLPAKLSAAGSAVLSWLVRGCLEWQRDGGRLNPPPFVIEKTDEWRKNEDIIRGWLEIEAELDPQAETRATTAYNSFAQWYQTNVGSKLPSQRWFGSRLLKRFERVKRSHGYVYLGLRVEYTADV